MDFMDVVVARMSVRSYSDKDVEENVIKIVDLLKFKGIIFNA